MEEKIFKEGMSLEQLAKTINKIVKKELPIKDLNDKTSSIEKWTSIPNILVYKDEEKLKFIEFIEYLDGSFMPIKDKALIITSLCGLMEYAKIDITKYDVGSLHLIAEYYVNKSFDDMKNTINIIGSQEILFAIRKKSLDIEDRKKILSIVEKSLNDDKIDSTDLKAVQDYIAKKVKEIEETNY
jgi:hypothetical protein